MSLLSSQLPKSLLKLKGALWRFLVNKGIFTFITPSQKDKNKTIFEYFENMHCLRPSLRAGSLHLPCLLLYFATLVSLGGGNDATNCESVELH